MTQDIRVLTGEEITAHSGCVGQCHTSLTNYMDHVVTDYNGTL